MSMTVWALMATGLALIMINFFVKNIFLSFAVMACFIGVILQTGAPDYLRVASVIIIAGVVISVTMWGVRKTRLLG